MIELSTLKAAQEVHQLDLFRSHFIYLMPSSKDEVVKRIIRERVGSETDKSLEHKLALAEKEMK